VGGRVGSFGGKCKGGGKKKKMKIYEGEKMCGAMKTRATQVNTKGEAQKGFGRERGPGKAGRTRGIMKNDPRH